MNALAKHLGAAAAASSHYSATSSNPADRLPEEKREKFLALQDQREALHGAMPTGSGSRALRGARGV